MTVCGELCAQLKRCQLLQGDGDIWYGESLQVAQGDDYRFALESNWNDCFNTEGKTLYRRDPYARYCPEVEGAFCRVDGCGTNFKWQCPEPPRFLQSGLAAHSLYELHVGTFSPEGTFKGAMDRLEHIASLGFTCIELMPITEFGGSWGYNPRSCLAIHSAYGTPDDFRAFVDKAHKLKVAVMVDLCLNHGSTRLNSLWNWDGFGPNDCGGIYFDKGGGNTPWGKKFAFDRAEVQEYLLDACRCFLEEYHIDGLRMDSVHNVPEWLNSNLCRAVRAEFPGVCISGEAVPEDPRYLLDGIGFNAIWLHQPVFDLLDSAGGEHRGGEWPAKVRSMIRARWFPDNAASTGINALLGSHDQVGCRKNGGRGDDGRLRRYFIDHVGGRKDWTARAKTRMWWAAVACGVVSGVPMCFQGTETLQGGWWHVDKKMEWGLVPKGGLFGGGCEETKDMMTFVKDSLNLRREHPWLSKNGPNVVHQDDKNVVFGVMRGGEYLAVMNAGSGQWGDGGQNRYGIQVHEPMGPKARQIFCSQAKEYGGWDDAWTSKSGKFDLEVQDGKLNVMLPKWSVAVYQFGA
jgi:1,4-alpha-glucan branching enzyme